MKMSYVTCRCGKNVKGNTLRVHITGPKCTSSEDWKSEVLTMIDRVRVNHIAWLKSDGTDSIAYTDWWIRVLEKVNSLEDWVFIPPRATGVMRSSSANTMSKKRVGLNNPACKTRIKNYPVDKIRRKSKELFSNFKKDETLPFKDIHSKLSKLFPDFMYQFCEVEIQDPEKRGHNQQNAVIAYLLELPIEEVVSMNIKRRGLFISKGQKASPKCIESASRMGSQMLSKWRVTKPQQKLYGMVKEYDPAAVMEYRIKCFSRYRSFDIYSPKINTLFEMHGRVWHDYTKEILRDVVTKNIKNDEFKKKIAEENGKDLLVFWDDQQETWESELRRIYEEIKGEEC
jgi:hypothetical protein